MTSNLQRTALAVLLAGAAAAGATAPAQAASIDGDTGRLTYRGAPGEANDVLLSGAPGTPARISFHDLGAPITAWPAGVCEKVDEGVRCGVPASVHVELGDGADSFGLHDDPHPHELRVAGGAGDDELTGQAAGRPKTFEGGEGNDLLKPHAGDDVVRGGPGNDILWGDSGHDALYGEDGDDELKPDNGHAPGNDVVDGGPGVDHVDDWVETAAGTAPPVSISLDGVANDGRPGEQDNVVAVEKAEPKVSGRFVLSDARDEWQIVASLDGGSSTVLAAGGDDRIVGGDHAESIDGGPGDDHLEGGRRNDAITGGPGADTILGDVADTGCAWAPEHCLIFGDDTIDARDGQRDTVDCGPGNDVAVVDAVDVHSGCETVDLGGPGPQARKPRLSPKKARLRRALRAGFVVRLAGATPGRATVVARRGRKVVAKGKGTVSAQGTATVRVRFTRAARRSLPRVRVVRLTLSAAGATATLTLRR